MHINIHFDTPSSLYRDAAGPRGIPAATLIVPARFAGRVKCAPACGSASRAAGRKRVGINTYFTENHHRDAVS